MLANRLKQHPLVAKAIALFGAERFLARRIGVSQQHVNRLLNRKQRITAEVAIKIDRATEGKVPKHELRPDLFDPPSAAAQHQNGSSNAAVH